MCKICGCFGHSKVESLVLNVSGMSCDHCKKAVEQSVLGLHGVLAAEADVTKGILTVQYNQHKNLVENIKKAVQEAGYDIQ